MNYFVCGFMGAGKSTWLEKKKLQVADNPKYTFIDLDLYIFEKYGAQDKNLGEYIERVGLGQFRDNELKSLEDILQNTNQYIALGGGCLRDETLKLLNQKGVQGHWLDTSFEICWERIKNDKTRPLVKLGRQVLQKLYVERSISYSIFPCCAA